MLLRERTLVTLIAVVLAICFLSGCGVIVSSISSGFADDLSNSVLNSDDIDLVKEGLPPYLLMVDALLAKHDNHVKLLIAGATLNHSYATAFVKDPVRQKVLTTKALEYALKAACIEVRWLCSIRTADVASLENNLTKLKTSQIPVGFALAATWVAWIQTHSDDWSAIADLGRVRPLVERINELNPSYQFGAPSMYLGVFDLLVPATLGGRPESGRKHFEKALELSDGKFLYTKVLFAEYYARMIFNRDLHDSLLNEVLTASPEVPGMTLQNRIAQVKARELLESADAYF